MLRRISTKLVLAVLVAVVLPFVAFAFFIDEAMAERLPRHSAEQTLLGLVKDLAGQIDYFVDERRRDLELWAGAPHVQTALEEDRAEERTRARARRGEGPPGSGLAWDAATLARLAREGATSETFDFGLSSRWETTREFDRFMAIQWVYDLVLLLSEDGRLVSTSSRRPVDGPPLEPEFLARLFATDYTAFEWFTRARDGEAFVRIDQHVSPFHLEDPEAVALDPAWGYQLGFAVPVGREEGALRGVLFALVNWKYVQDLISNEVITNAFRGLVSPGREPSPYAWLWAEDADTIRAHPERALYGKRVSADLGLPQMTAAVRADEDGWGLYPEYTFQGEEKNAAFHRCRSSLAGGFGWVVGVGVNNQDIFATAEELRALLLGGTALVLALAVCLTLYIARRTTAPVRELQRQARRVAEGDLDARVERRSRDELGALAEDFNRMTAELKTQRERIVKAEKDAAWREMARQIAHDIKNPLTPITLSLDLLARARRDRHEGSEEILERTMGLMRRQVEHLREIANDFYEFTGGRKPEVRPLDAAALLEEVLHLHDAWAVERGVAVQREGASLRVLADPGKLRRVLVNLVSNALQAMPEGGALHAATAEADGSGWITIRDTGTGIAPEARAHLFEPYFTTKSEGTGLGLAIARRALEDMGGEIELTEAPDGVGTVARVRLPLAPAEPT
jgi:signal transduction histidine kinase